MLEHLHTLRRTTSITTPIIVLKHKINCILADSMKTDNTIRLSACGVCVCVWVDTKHNNNNSDNKSNNSWGISRVFQHICHLQGRFSSARRSVSSAHFSPCGACLAAAAYGSGAQKRTVDSTFMCFIALFFVVLLCRFFCLVTALLLLVFIVVVCVLCLLCSPSAFHVLYFGRVCDGALQITVEKH